MDILAPFQTVKKWVSSVSKVLFCYKNGFFELPYLCNSPMLMLESLKELPVHRFDKEEQAIYTNNPFTSGVMRYQEVEEGFWVIAVEIKFHANVRTTATFDDSAREYYYLTFSLYESEVTASINNKVKLQNKGWTFYRPGQEIDAYHYKGATCIVFQFVFNQTWFEKNISFKNIQENNNFQQFLHADTGFTYWQDIAPKAEHISRKIWTALQAKNDAYLKIMSVKILSLEIIFEFFANFNKYDFSKNFGNFDEADRKSITHAERIILDHLTKPFPGIETIAKEVNLSPTKLKATFKAVYGKTLFTYYREKQMDLALQILMKDPVQIKEVAYSLGYESPSKFTAAFKNHHQMLPSEVPLYNK